MNGDGCSSQCKIEPGFKCYKTSGPDICYDIVAPTAELVVTKANKLIITFSETVIIRANATELIKTMNVSLKGIPPDCKFDWYINGTFKRNIKLLSLEIVTIPQCSLKENYYEFIVEFKDTTIISDLAWNELTTKELAVKNKKFNYVSLAEKEALSSAGGLFKSVSLLTLVMMLLFVVLQSVALGNLWAFINMIQMVSYLPIINCYLPYNFETFLNEYLTIKKVSIPFKMLPSWIYNPLNLFIFFETIPFNLKFQLSGYETISFLYNFADELMTWCLVFMLYCTLKILSFIIPKDKYFIKSLINRCNFIHNMKAEYEYNGVCRILLESFLNLNFCAFMNIWSVFLNNFYRSK